MRKYIYSLMVFILLATLFSVYSYADDFNVLLDKAKSTYEEGDYQETEKHLLEMLAILHTKIGDPDPTELQDAGDGFYYSNVNFEE